MTTLRALRPGVLFLCCALLAACGSHGLSQLLLPQRQTVSSQSDSIAAVAGAQQSWSTWGFDRRRTGYNPLEKTISSANAAHLTQKWVFDSKAGQHIDTQPIVVSNISVNGVATTIAFVADETGNLYAVNAATGAKLWQLALGRTNAEDAGCGTFSNGITSAPVYDRSRNRLYVVDGAGMMWAFDPATGAQSPGFPPVQVFLHPKVNHTWSALLLSADNSTVYFPTASHCDEGTYYGTVNAINADTQKITTFNLVTSRAKYHGNGVWNWGGETIDPNNQNLYTTSGNSLGSLGETGQYSDSVIELSPKMIAVNSMRPEGNLSGNLDIGATPVLYDDQGFCIAFERKNGDFFTMSRYHMQDGNVGSTLALGGELATPAYDPVTHALYAAPPRGLVRMNAGPNCTATIAWTAKAALQGYTVPVIANGVVYFTAANVAYAVDAVTGAKLWNSGTGIGGNVAAAPTVVNGTLYVAAWDGKLYAFGLSAASAVR